MCVCVCVCVCVCLCVGVEEVFLETSNIHIMLRPGIWNIKWCVLCCMGLC